MGFACDICGGYFEGRPARRISGGFGNANICHNCAPNYARDEKIEAAWRRKKYGSDWL